METAITYPLRTKGEKISTRKLNIKNILTTRQSWKGEDN